MAIPTYTATTLPTSGQPFSTESTDIANYLLNADKWIGDFKAYLNNTKLENQYIGTKAIKSANFYPQIFKFPFSYSSNIINVKNGEFLKNVASAQGVDVSMSPSQTGYDTFFTEFKGYLTLRNFSATNTLEIQYMRVIRDTIPATSEISLNQNGGNPSAIRIKPLTTKIIPVYIIDQTTGGFATPKFGNTSYKYTFDFLVYDITDPASSNAVELSLLYSYLIGLNYNQYAFTL